MKILVTGGAGYVGSFTVKKLLQEGHEVVVFDSLEKGHREAISCPIITEDLRDFEEIKTALKTDDFETVLHFAAYIESEESMENPLRFFENNTEQMIRRNHFVL